MKKVIVILVCALILGGVSSMIEGCKAQNKTSSSQGREQATRYDAQQGQAAYKAVMEYIQAVIDKDTSTINRLSPQCAAIPERTIVGTIFHTTDVSDVEIGKAQILTTKEYRNTLLSFDSAYASDQSLLDMSKMQKKLMDMYGAADIVFYRFEVKKTSSKKRKLFAYVTAIKTKEGSWLTAPGPGEGFYTYN
ncbi:MAG: hypothetical protein FWC54_03340 [Actinomycetia bacterium]|nr:hypothetical protein [Actinomycetes bacterium]